MRIRRAFAAVAVAALALPAAASAHAVVSPIVVKAKTLQFFTLSVPTEKENATTTTIELTPPSGFTIDSFQPTPGWKRDVKSTGSGDSAVVTKVTWSGGKVPTGEDSVFGFNASTNGSKTYAFTVRQTYSDGEVVDWSGPESSDTPAPRLEAKSSIGGGGSSTLAIVALIVAGAALVLGAVGLLSGKRSLA
ncbi:MAG: DUF1775 domain-containing protein [Actinobacteria bacterium]|nr:MAG: DUF1775 domain-containing protein [Actinomycetota bacterium]